MKISWSQVEVNSLDTLLGSKSQFIWKIMIHFVGLHLHTPHTPLNYLHSFFLCFLFLTVFIFYALYGVLECPERRLLNKMYYYYYF